ncbi:hypothetical protein [Paenibacillus sp. GCM10012303]|uniref:hypothetical protein n=1 Tax=Paenibacillus sp. GCM10012303 TaxID=3317340 RepID=UPI00361BEF0D
MKDQPVLFYCKDGVLYPVALTEEHQRLFEMLVSTLSPLRVVFDQPQGSAVNLLGKSN